MLLEKSKSKDDSDMAKEHMLICDCGEEWRFLVPLKKWRGSVDHNHCQWCGKGWIIEIDYGKFRAEPCKCNETPFPPEEAKRIRERVATVKHFCCWHAASMVRHYEGRRSDQEYSCCLCGREAVASYPSFYLDASEELLADCGRELPERQEVIRERASCSYWCGEASLHPKCNPAGDGWPLFGGPAACPKVRWWQKTFGEASTCAHFGFGSWALESAGGITCPQLED